MKLKKFSCSAAQRIAIILLIAVFIIAGVIACSSDAITGGRGGGYYSSYDEGDGGDGGTSGGDGSTGGDGGASGGDGNTGDGGTSGGDGNTGDGGTSGGDGSSGGDDNTPSLPNDNPYDYYDLRVPFVVEKGYTNVSYKDTNKLKQLWFDQINRKAANDGKVFAIRNRSNNRDPNNFQNNHTHGSFSAQDYYYFNENGDIVYKQDNTIIKKFMGATIVRYRDLDITRGKKMGFNGNNTGAIVTIKWSERKHDGKPLHTVGAIYANALTTAEAKAKYHWDSTGNDPFKDGVYDFIASRYYIEDYHDGFTIKNGLFERQYTTTGFVEILVMVDYDNDGFAGAAAVHSYYPYFGNRNTTDGFTAQNLPYMTNHNRYLAQRPEFTMNQLNHVTLFTDGYWRHWCYMFMPGHKN